MKIFIIITKNKVLPKVMKIVFVMFKEYILSLEMIKELLTSYRR